MNHKNKNIKSNHLNLLIKTIICLLIVSGIIYMKFISDEQKALLPNSTHQIENVDIAIPDTTVSTDIIPISTDSVVPSILPDTVLGKDKRRPYEAGYEDGYAAGCDDGFDGHTRNNYDESNNFSTESEQNEYVRGYQEGYETGFKDGKNGKQFNI